MHAKSVTQMGKCPLFHSGVSKKLSCITVSMMTLFAAELFEGCAQRKAGAGLSSVQGRPAPQLLTRIASFSGNLKLSSVQIWQNGSVKKTIPARQITADRFLFAEDLNKPISIAAENDLVTLKLSKYRSRQLAVSDGDTIQSIVNDTQIDVLNSQDICPVAKHYNQESLVASCNQINFDQSTPQHNSMRKVLVQNDIVGLFNPLLEYANLPSLDWKTTSGTDTIFGILYDSKSPDAIYLTSRRGEYEFAFAYIKSH
jgi:hypothetical protein